MRRPAATTAATLFLVTALPALLLAFAGESAVHWLCYERTAIGDGQWWRLLSGHWLHLSWYHLSFNLGALLLFTLVFHRLVPPCLWLLTLGTGALAVGGGLYLFSPQVGWYVGLSGILHTLWAVGATRLVQNGERLIGKLLLAALAVKILWEQLAPPNRDFEQVIGGMVIIDAHLYGAIAGLLLGVAWRVQPR